MGRIEFALRSIAPEQEDDDLNALEGTMLADATDGQEGSLLGAGVIAVEAQEELVEIVRDSYTLEKELFYKGAKGILGATGGGGVAVATAPARATAGGGQPAKGGNQAAPAGQTSGKYAIRIIRGVSTQTVRLKK